MIVFSHERTEATMPYRLLALDMDGTLLTSDKRVSPRTRAALEGLAARGVPIAFCTGRNVAELLDFPRELPFVRYGVLSSGALVRDFAEGMTIARHTMAADVVLRAMELAAPERPMPHVMALDDSIARPSDLRDMARFGMGVYQPMFERICVRAEDLPAWVRAHPDEVAKLNFYHRDTASRQRTRARIEEAGLSLTLADAEETSLECSPLGMSKAEGLRTLAAHLGITTDDVVCVGDADNDLAALGAVGMPVAMGNASPAVMRLAKLVVADNDNDGVAEVVERLF